MFDFLKPWTPNRSAARARLHLENLEIRCVPTVLTPAQVRHAYGFDQLPYDGSGQTIALVLAHDNPTAAQDLHTFDRQFGLPDPTLLKATEGSQVSYDPGWALESSLDLEWAHAIAPRATLLLVEAASTSLSDLMGAVDYARHFPGVSVVSMSWGAGEFPGENQLDGLFTTPAGHTGVTFVAASGDTGGQTIYPSTSPNVVAVGGTSLIVSGGAYVRETGWGGSGGGFSSFEGEPSYQAGTQASGRRTTPDVAYNADPNTGVLVVSGGAWYGVGGTSAGAPQWAGLFALVDQGLARQGVPSLDGRTQALPALYALARSHYSSDFHDVTSGRAGGFTANAGYDLVTGLGSPVANALVPGLIGSFSRTAVANTGPSTGRPAGTSGGLTIIIRLVEAGPSTDGNLGSVVASVMPAAPGAFPAFPRGTGGVVNLTAPPAPNAGLWPTEPASSVRTSRAAVRLAHSTAVNQFGDPRADTGQDSTGTPADDQPAPDSPAAPAAAELDALYSDVAPRSGLRITNGHRSTEVLDIRPNGINESPGSTPNTLAAAAVLAVAMGGISRGSVGEAEARRRRPFSAEQSS
jgi:hypothetical protein